MKIAVYGNRHQEPFAEPLARFFTRLGEEGVDVIMHSRLYQALTHLMPRALKAVTRVIDDSDFTADIALSIGGDGAILRTAMWVGDKEIPILGINTGHLGFLSAASIDELPQVLDELLLGHFDIENRSLLHVQEPTLQTWPYALNEVAIDKDNTSSMIAASTVIDGQPLATYRADGLIISTPTGSTAYNLSVGGPIIAPSAPVWVLSPVSAHSLGMRPLVVADSRSIEVIVDSRSRVFRVSLDGRSESLPVGTTVKIARAPFTVRLVRRPGHEFARTLREKLFWGVDNTFSR